MEKDIYTNKDDNRLTGTAERLVAESVKTKVLSFFAIFAIAGSLGIYSFLATIENRISSSIKSSLSDETEAFRNDTLLKLSDARTKADNARVQAEDSLQSTLKISERVKRAESEIEKAEEFSKSVAESAESISEFLLKNPKFKNDLTAALSEVSLRVFQWEEATLEGAWEPYGGVYMSPRYAVDSVGVVHLMGLVKSGTGTIFTLPEKLRPSAQLVFPVLSASTIGRIDVTVEGAVFVQKGSSSWVSLSGISFIPE